MGTTNPIPSAGRPTTSRTGAPNPSPSSRSSKVVTMPVTMVTIMTTRNFIRILMGNSGSRQVRRDWEYWKHRIGYSSTSFKKKKKKNWLNVSSFSSDWLPFVLGWRITLLCIYLSLLVFFFHKRTWTLLGLQNSWTPYGVSALLSF